MTRLLREPDRALLILLLMVSPAAAQTPAQPAATPPPPAVSESTSPMTTTFDGDTGLWYVPSARVLQRRQFSLSGYRRGTNYVQGYTNVGEFAGTFAFGLTEHAELFGSFVFDRRIDRDVRPLFVNDPAFGGVVDRHPQVDVPWSSDKLGDFSIGAKVNLWSESRLNGADMALRGIVKLPTGDKIVGTGNSDFLGDFIVSKEARQRIEISGYAGYEWVGSPDDFDIPGGAFRWGAGAAFPSRKAIRAFTELNGRVLSSDTVTTTGTGLTSAGVVPPATSAAQNLTTITAGVTGQTVKGFFVGAGISWNGPSRERDLRNPPDDPGGDYWDWQIRIGYHPGGRRQAVTQPVVQPAPAPPRSETPAAPQNRPPTVSAQCNPCTLDTGGSSTLTADARDPDGDVLSYRWSAPAGTLASPTERQTTWSAPQQEGAVRITVTVNDGKGGTASGEVTLQVARAHPVAKAYTFDDVYFDFDRYTLRPEARLALDDAVKQFQSDPTLRVLVEGHTCNIGTAEYNLALGDRRANAVRDYLVSHGVPLDRLTTVSYGEERPKYDNSREETRRLNRRAVLTVRLQQ